MSYNVTVYYPEILWLDQHSAVPILDVRINTITHSVSMPTDPRSAQAWEGDAMCSHARNVIDTEAVREMLRAERPKECYVSVIQPAAPYTSNDMNPGPKDEVATPKPKIRIKDAIAKVEAAMDDVQPKTYRTINPVHGSANEWLLPAPGRALTPHEILQISDRCDAEIQDMNMRLAAEPPKEDAVEKSVNETLDHITNNRVVPKQMDKLSDALARSKRDRSLSGAIGRSKT